MALLVILILYLGIGVMSAVGSMAISKKLFSAKAEQIFFGVLLTPIAAFYLAFTAYFGSSGAWRLEAITVVIFAVLGTLGVRVTLVLLIGYATHGIWDLLHELHIHACSRSLWHEWDVGDPSSLWSLLRYLRLVHDRVFLYPA